jgi:hypothetical protein
MKPDGTKTDPKTKKSMLGENQIVDTAEHFVLVKKGESYEPAVLTMTSSNLSVSRKWLTLLKMKKINVKGQAKEPPSFLYRFNLSTVQAENDLGSFNRAYGKFTITGKKGEKVDGIGKTIREPYTNDLWKQHLDGTNSLGVIPINEDNKCKWGCLDVDDYSVDLEKISKDFAKKNLIICRTKSGGGHIFIFTKKFVSAKSMIDKLKDIVKAFGFVKYDLRPQQTKLLDEKDVGSWLNMPYFGGKETDRYALYDGKVLSPEHFIQWIEKFAVDSLDDIDLSFIKKINKIEEKLPGGPPCLHYLILEFI